MANANFTRRGSLPPLEIIRAALRDAATAPTVYDALDVTGEALLRLAELAREESSQSTHEGLRGSYHQPNVEAEACSSFTV